MSYSLQDYEYEKIKNLFYKHQELLVEDFESRMKKALRVLHFQYLWGSCREAEISLRKYDKNNLFDLIMLLYAKRRKIHQANFLLLHCFENALRSTLCVKIANLYNQNQDDWFLNKTPQNKRLKAMLKLVDMRKSHLKSEAKSSWEVFDCFYLVDLEDIIKWHWNELSYIFKDRKTYKDQPLPSYNKDHLLTTISRIRKVRNEIFHNKPTKIKFRKDLETLLLRLDFNLEEAVKIGEISSVINLQYNYKKNQ